MKKVLKWAGIGLGGVVLLLALTGFVVNRISVSRQNEKYSIDPEGIVIPTDAESLAEGERLFAARGCAECHGAGGEGRVMIDNGAIGLLAGSNLTKRTARYSTKDWVRTVRHGVLPDGRAALLMPSHEYFRMPDAELGKIVAYIKTLPMSDNEVPACEVGFVGSILHVAGMFPLIPAEMIEDHSVRNPAPDPAPTVEYGEYLAEACRGCHGPQLSGGPIPGAPPEMGSPANITPHASGLRDWTEEQFFTLMRTGRRPDGSEVNPAQMPWGVYRHMTDTELTALFAFLKTVPPVEEGNR